MGSGPRTHKGTKKRFKVTATGKVRHRKSFRGHLLSGRSGDRLRRLRKPGYLVPAFAKKVRQVLNK